MLRSAVRSARVSLRQDASMTNDQMPSDEGMRRELQSLLRVMVGVVNARKGAPIPPDAAWENDAQNLAIKMIWHVHSVTRLCDESSIDIGPGQEIPFVDYVSATVVARAALETLLVFAYVYGDTEPEVCKFRHAAWKLGGLADRQAFAPMSEETRNKQASEARAMAELRKQLESSPVMAAFSGKQRQQILKGRWDALVQMWQLGVGAGIGETFFRTLYKSVSTHAHSAWSGVLQVRDVSRSLDEQRQLAGSSISMALLFAALFTEKYCEAFSTGREYLIQDPSAAELVGRWARIARGVGDFYATGGGA